MAESQQEKVGNCFKLQGLLFFITIFELYNRREYVMVNIGSEMIDWSMLKWYW